MCEKKNNLFTEPNPTQEMQRELMESSEPMISRPMY
jgi:hypothetical protein